MRDLVCNVHEFIQFYISMGNQPLCDEFQVRWMEQCTFNAKFTINWNISAPYLAFGADSMLYNRQWVVEQINERQR